MVNRILRKASASRPAPSTARLNQPGAWDFFLSHGQAAAGDQVKMLCFLLRQRGKKVWYDNEMDNKSTAAMEEGVRGSENFVLFLSGDIAPPSQSTTSRRSSAAAGFRSEPEPHPCLPSLRLRFVVRNVRVRDLRLLLGLLPVALPWFAINPEAYKFCQWYQIG